MLNKNIYDKPVCVFTNYITRKIRYLLPFYNYNFLIDNFFENFSAHLKPCEGTIVK